MTLRIIARCFSSALLLVPLPGPQIKAAAAVSLAALVLIGGTLIATSVAARASAAAGPAETQKAAQDEIIPVKAATTQEEARHLARTVDLPQIAKADRVEIMLLDPKNNIKIDDAATLAALRSALVVTNDPPSGGVNAACLAFYCGDTLIRTIWVFPDGEWGIERPGTGWTCGLNRKLIDAINAVRK